MTPERSTTIEGKLIEEFYWNGVLVVYVDHRRTHLPFETACAMAQEGDLVWTSHST